MSTKHVFGCQVADRRSRVAGCQVAWRWRETFCGLRPGAAIIHGRAGHADECAGARPVDRQPARAAAGCAGAAAGAMRPDRWNARNFGGLYPQIYALDHLTAGQVDGVERMLGLAPGTRILDVCCGYGRHALELGRRGYRHVVGVDVSRPLLARARRAARAEGLRVTFRQADMRRLPFRRSFDVALNLFTSFGYIADEAEDQAALRAMARALRPGGRLLMDLLNREWLVRHFQPRYRETTALGVVSNHLTFDLETGRLRNVRRFRKDGRPRSLAIEFRVYTLAEMVRMLREAGLAFQRAYGNFAGAAYGMDTFRMIIVASKPERRKSVRRYDRSAVR